MPCTARSKMGEPHPFSVTFFFFNYWSSFGGSSFMFTKIIDTFYWLKSIVYMRVHSFFCTFYGFWQTRNDMYPSLKYQAECFHCPKIPLCPGHASLPLSPHPLSITELFPVSKDLPFPNVIWRKSQSLQPFRTGFFHRAICIYVSSLFFHGFIAHYFFQCPVSVV